MKQHNRCRAVSVWAPQRPGLKLRGTIVLVTVICIYSVLTGMVRSHLVSNVLKPRQLDVFDATCIKFTIHK